MLVVLLSCSPALVEGRAGDTAMAGDLALCINELMPANASAFYSKGETPDWIELHNPGTRAVSLQGWTLTGGDQADPADELQTEIEVKPGGFMVLQATGEADHMAGKLGFRLSAEGGQLGLFDGEGNGQVIEYGYSETDYAWARSTDCCEGDGCWDTPWMGTPGRSNEVGAGEEILVVPAGSNWRFWDRGTAPDPAWLTADFDWSSWDIGPAPLGYGDDHLQTVVGYGPDAEARYVTTWFRRTFELADAALALELSGQLLRDDGALVWLNGQEASRSNLPAGAIDETTLATTAVGGGEEEAYWPFELDPGLLVEGVNVVGVEVHQAAANSSDLGFDLELSVTR